MLNHHPEFYIKHLVNHKATTELFHDHIVNNQQYHYKSACSTDIFLGPAFPTQKDSQFTKNGFLVFFLVADWLVKKLQIVEKINLE